mgnify:CR=1 FL=1
MTFPILRWSSTESTFRQKASPTSWFIDDFSRMPNLFVITILNFDPFGYDYMMYTFENRCTEVEGLKYEDGLKFIYFYTGGTKGGNGNIKTMLQYLHHTPHV